MQEKGINIMAMLGKPPLNKFMKAMLLLKGEADVPLHSRSKTRAQELAFQHMPEVST